MGRGATYRHIEYENQFTESRYIRFECDFYCVFLLYIIFFILCTIFERTQKTTHERSNKQKLNVP